MTKLKLIALAVVAVAVLAVSSAGAAGAGPKTQTLRFFDKPTSITLTAPDGKVIDNPPYPEPKPGDVRIDYQVHVFEE